MIRTAIIGTGNAARLHLAAARAVQDLQIVAFAGRNRPGAEALAASAGDRAAVLTAEEAVRSASIDAVILAVPASLQPALAIAAFESGKHVLCEKPLAPSADEAHAIARAWQSAGTVGMVNFSYRLIPAIAEFRRQLDAGVCGALSAIEAHWVLSSRLDPGLPYSWKADAAAGGGALRNFGSHVIDYLFHDKDARVMSAWQRTLTPERRDAAGAVQRASADEVMTALFAVDGWCPVMVHVSLVTQPQVGHSLVARGSKGTLTAWNTSATSPAGPFECAFSSAPPAPWPRVEAGGHPDLSVLFRPVLSRFSAAIAGRGDAVPGITAGVRVAEIVEAVAARAAHF